MEYTKTKSHRFAEYNGDRYEGKHWTMEIYYPSDEEMARCEIWFPGRAELKVAPQLLKESPEQGLKYLIGIAIKKLEKEILGA